MLKIVLGFSLFSPDSYNRLVPIHSFCYLQYLADHTKHEHCFVPDYFVSFIQILYNNLNKIIFTLLKVSTISAKHYSSVTLYTNVTLVGVYISYHLNVVRLQIPPAKSSFQQYEERLYKNSLSEINQIE